MSSDSAVEPPEATAEVRDDAASPAPEGIAPTWGNDATAVEILLDEQDPHSSVMELLVGDLEGRLGAVYVGLGPMEVRALLRQLQDVQLAQEIAEWEAEGNDVEDFPVDGPVDTYDDIDDDDDDDDYYDDITSGSRVDRLTDPLAVKTWIKQDYRVFGIPVLYLLVGMAVLVGFIMAAIGVIL